MAIIVGGTRPCPRHPGSVRARVDCGGRGQQSLRRGPTLARDEDRIATRAATWVSSTSTRSRRARCALRLRHDAPLPPRTRTPPARRSSTWTCRACVCGAGSVVNPTTPRHGLPAAQGRWPWSKRITRSASSLPHRQQLLRGEEKKPPTSQRGHLARASNTSRVPRPRSRRLRVIRCARTVKAERRASWRVRRGRRGGGTSRTRPDLGAQFRTAWARSMIAREGETAVSWR